MPIQVYSEIAPLRRVLLHRPGQELEHLVPGFLERLLFDDIPYLKGAQAEHDRFAQSEYARLFPKHWSHLEYLRDTEELKKKLEDFWAE